MTSYEEAEKTLKQLESSLNDPGAHESFGALVSVLQCLDQLAVALRDDDLRPLFSSTPLPKILSTALRGALAAHTGDESDPGFEVVFQVGRVAANLAADCDEGRSALAAEGYPATVIDLFRRAKLPLHAQRSLVVSLVNLTIQSHEAIIAALSDWSELGPLLDLAVQISKPELQGSDDHWALAKYTWTIVQFVVKRSAEILAESASVSSLQPFGLMINCFLPENIDSLPKDTIPIQTLSIATAVLHTLSATDKVPSIASFSGDGTLIRRLSDFVEKASPPRLPPPDEEEEDAEGSDAEDEPASDPAKAMAKSKADVVRSIVNFSSELDYEDTRAAVLWQRMRDWLKSPREDLISCALLVFGNVVRKDETAKQMVSGEQTLLPLVIPLLATTTPIIVQHSLIGLLRNLSVLQVNRQELYKAGVLNKLVDMNVWTQERDLVGSVQGGAIGIFKHLCRDSAEIASSFVKNTQAVDQLLGVISRTDEAAMKWEGARIFVNATRSLSRSANTHGDDLATLSDRRIVEVLSDMIRTGSKHAILVNEAVISLALLASFGPPGTDVSIVESLANSSNTPLEQGYDRSIDVLDAIVSRKPEGPAVAEEIRANVEVLLKKLAEVPSRIVAIE